MAYLAKDAYYDFRVYQQFLRNNNLDNDSDTITVKSLQDYVKNHIDKEEYKEMRKEAEEAY